MARQTVKLTTPVWRDAPLHVQRWIEDVTRILTDGVEGQDAVKATSDTTAAIVDGSKSINVSDTAVGSVAAALEAVSANAATAQATATAVAGGSTSTLSGSISPRFGTAGTSLQVTFTATGGSGVYTGYAWVKSSGSSSININNSTISNPTFTTAATGERSANWTCTVTDDNGDTFPAQVSVTLSGSDILP